MWLNDYKITSVNDMTRNMDHLASRSSFSGQRENWKTGTIPIFRDVWLPCFTIKNLTQNYSIIHNLKVYFLKSNITCYKIKENYNGLDYIEKLFYDTINSAKKLNKLHGHKVCRIFFNKLDEEKMHM